MRIIWDAAATNVCVQILEMFEERGVSIWVPWHMTPPRLLGLTGSVAQLELTPGEATVYSWVKAATSIMELYDPDVSNLHVLSVTLFY